MGKKRVVDKSAKGGRGRQGRGQAGLKKVRGKKFTRGKVYIHSTYNNTILTLSDNNDEVAGWVSAGVLGFKGPKRATPFAAAEIAKALVEKASETGLQEVEVYVKGIGAGRGAAIRSLASQGLDIIFIKDVTPIPHGGPRPPRPRRV